MRWIVPRADFAQFCQFFLCNVLLLAQFSYFQTEIGLFHDFHSFLYCLQIIETKGKNHNVAKHDTHPTFHFPEVS